MTAINQDAEAAVLGSIFLRPDVLSSCSLAEEHFHDLRHRAVFRAMRRLESAGTPVDELTVQVELERAGELVAAGGLSMLSGLSLKVPTAGNFDYYCELVSESALTRAVLSATAEIQEKHRRGALIGSALLDAALQIITRLDVGQPAQSLSIGEVVKARVKRLGELADARARGEIVATGVPTGIDALDSMTGGFPFGLVTIGAGRPGMGKSAFALGAADAASARGFGVHVFSFEDSREMYADRTIAHQTRIPVQRLTAGRLFREDMPALAGALRELAQRQTWRYDDVGSLSAEELVRAVRRERVRNKTQLVIVDYFQLLKRPARYESVHDAHSQNMLTLATAAKQDGIAYLVLSQLNREVERRADKRPQMSDLRESGSLEERAKLIFGFYRGAKYGDPQKGVDYEDRPPSAADWERRIDILVMKNSQGEEGFVRCEWDGPTTRMLPRSRGEE